MNSKVFLELLTATRLIKRSLDDVIIKDHSIYYCSLRKSKNTLPVLEDDGIFPKWFLGNMAIREIIKVI